MNGEGILDGFDGWAVHQENPKPANDLRGRLGDIGECGFDGFALDLYIEIQTAHLV
jgi:hypothetical protein